MRKAGKQGRGWFVRENTDRGGKGGGDALRGGVLTNFGVEEEDEAAEASHAAVVVEVVFSREDRSFAVLHHKLLLNLATKQKQNRF